MWDTGTYDNRTEDSAGHTVPVTHAIERGHVSFDLHGTKLRGGYSLTRIPGRRDERGPVWLLVKKADRLAEPGSDPERDEPESVQSGKDIEQVADDK